MKLLSHLILQVFALLIVSYLIPGFYIADIRVAIVAAIVIGVINTFVKPVLHLLALPFTIITLGLFAFVINVLLLYVSAQIVPGFNIDSFLTAAVASIILALITSFFYAVMKEK